MSKLLLVCALGAGATAQIPFDHLLVVNRVASTTVPAMNILDPAAGTVTPVLPLTASLAQSGARSVAIDPLAPSTLYSIASVSISVSASIPVLQLTGNRFTRTNLPVNLGVPGQPFHLRWAAGQGLLLLGRGGQVNRMFLRDMASGVVTSQPTPTLLPNNAADMTFAGGKAYALSEGDGSPTATSTIVEWDLVANTDRIVGSGYIPFHALQLFNGLLLAGDAVGTLHHIDLVTGAATPFLATGLGKITSIAAGAAGRLCVVAESGTTWTVHDVFAPGAPLYTSTVAVDDLAFGPSPVATALTYGAGCVGSTSAAPVLGFAGMPALGALATVNLGSALPNTAALLVFGGSRVADAFGPLPRDLVLLGMPSCTQYNDLGGTLLVLANATGAAQLSILVPNNPALAGARVPMQWLCLDAAANAFGATTSNGGEWYVY